MALNSVGFNLTRSVGPAIGGAIVAAAGAAAAFAVNALSYLALIVVLVRWRPAIARATLPRERLGAAMGAGLRYVAMSPNILKVLLRAFLFGLTAIAVLALLPLVARDLVQGGPLVYGVLLGAFGVGAIGGALLGGRLRDVLSSEAIVRLAFAGFAVCARGPRRRARAPGRAALGDAGRRRLLGAGAGALQRHGAALDAALGGRAGARALPDGGLRRHGARQLALGQRRRGATVPRTALLWRGRRRCVAGGAVGLLAAAAGAGRAQPRPAEPLDRAAGRGRPQAAQRADPITVEYLHRRGGRRPSSSR